jgi:hypothetical protein
MAPFELLPASDRIAIIHYIRTLIPNPANDPLDVVTQLSGGGAVAGGGTTTTAAADTAKAGPRIPIVLALRASARVEPAVGKKLSRLPSGEEGDLSKHASPATGLGRRRARAKLAVYPYIMQAIPASLTPGKNKKELEKIVVGLPENDAGGS